MKESESYKIILEELDLPIITYSKDLKRISANQFAVKLLKRSSVSDEDLLVENQTVKISGKEYDITRYPIDDGSIVIVLKERISDFRIIMAEKERSIEAFRSKMLGEMAGGLSHEINTPLGTITLCADLLSEIAYSKYSADEILIETIKDIKDATDGISDVIRSFKFFVRDDRNDQFVFYSLNDLISKIKNLFKIQMIKYSVDFRVENTIEDKKIILECNPTKIAQILSNLIKNSLDEVKSSDDVWIELYVKENKDYLIFLVRDSGAGIPKNIIQDIFTPLFTTKKVGEGSGIGLSICREFVREHGGTLQYLCENNVTCFEVKIPKIQKA
jgi:C4-dicarboxylate-specific signal transduction histidine kinase